MGWIRCVRCESLRHNFVARTFTLIAPVQPILHWVYCRNKTIPNAPKRYEMQQKMSLGSNGVDWMRSLWKHPTWLRGTNFCINCTSSAHFASSLKQQRNGYKCTQTLRSATKHEFRVQLGGLVAFFAKTSDATLWHELLHYLHQFSPFCTEFTVVIKHTQMHQNTINAPKHEVTVQWGGSGALVVKNYDATSWHDIFH